MGVLLLLFLMKAAVTTSSVYVVTDRFSFGGVYEEKMEPELHYTRLSAANFDGEYTFLYTDRRRTQTWILGFGKTLSTAKAVYRAPAIAGRPAVTQWSHVYDKSREGKEEGIPWPSIRVVRVETSITGEELEKQIEGGEDFVTNEYIICKNHQSDLQIILRNSDEAAYCNGIADCRSESDELCPYVSIALATPYVYVVSGGRWIDGGTAFREHLI